VSRAPCILRRIDLIDDSLLDAAGDSPAGKNFCGDAAARWSAGGSPQAREIHEKGG